jgi:uncharacterized protein (UPF0548 family)
MLLHRPSDAKVRKFLSTQSRLPFSYSEAGSTRNPSALPAGYPINHYRGKLGAGREAFQRAVAAMRVWKMYSLSWTNLCWPETEIKEGAVVAVLATHFGLWSLNACRIIYTLEESTEPHRYGFAFGTLPAHVVEGEERFTVEWGGGSNEVSYELLAFARPRPWIARIGYPLVRAVQRRFAEESFEAMKRAVNQECT